MHYSELRLYLTGAQASPAHFKHMLKKLICWELPSSGRVGAGRDTHGLGLHRLVESHRLLYKFNLLYNLIY